ncbi:VaFE repeat-containing surface-anchored protein [Raoultibacter massiliensis]|uniref:VaFE repeat-containing surface-anchored protein n=1 Tax=Raoultibacter massiliensis TaxID=1852371 RepID=A0ABV1JH86_9ACTN
MSKSNPIGAGARSAPLRAILAALLAFSSLLAALSPTLTAQAHAAETAKLTVGSSIYYGGYSTNWMWADGKIAYCGNPSASTPPSGIYPKSALSAPSGRTAEAVADLWFGYGAPGFDASMWPDRWYDGSTMSDNHYAALTHILLSDTYTSDGNYAMYGCTEQFKDWVQYNVLGFGDSGEVTNPDATGRQIAARTGEVPRNFEAFQLSTGAGTQIILSFEYTPFGEIVLQKGSALPEVSGSNPCYSLAGAVYGVYSDSGLASRVGSIETDDNGSGRLGELVPGTYWVKETVPAKGYALDEAVYEVEVHPDMASAVNGAAGVADYPKSDPVGMLVMKVDATTGESSPQGSASLAGAEFTVRFYEGHYASAEEAEASGDPARTWVFATDGDGFADYADAYKVAGPDLYHMSNGDPTLPLGTAVIQETKAPAGYNLDDGAGGEPKAFCIQITDSGAMGEAVYTYNTPKAPDTVERGDFRLVKEIPIEAEDESGIVQEAERVLLPGVQFQLINASENPIVSPETGEKAETGEVVCTITTDENGLASTRGGLAVNGWDIPQGWSGALAYGTYTVHEVIPDSVREAFKAEYGHDIISVPNWKTTISAEGQYDPPALVSNHIPQTPLKVVKVDAETGLQIPLPCSFQLLDDDGELVTYESHYPDTHVMDTWTTNERGEVTLPMLLEQGVYTLVEVQAPEGYVKAIEGKTITVGAVYNDWDDPIEVEFADMPQKGTISVVKHDSATGEPVSDSVYVVKAASDIITGDGTVRAHAGDIVATLETDGEGRATSGELYLGTYTVYEAKAKDGYALDVAEKTVTLSYQGQDVAVFDEVLEVEDVPTELKVKKADALDPDKPVAGAVFRLWNDEETYDEELVTGEDGAISVQYLEHGSYHLQETSAPEGYVVSDVDDEGNAAIHDLTVNDQGMFEREDGTMSAVFEVEIANMPKTMGTTATDASSGTHEGQAREELSIVDVVEYTGCIPGDEYTVEGILMDAETGEPALDDDGNEITAQATFVAEDFAGSVEVTFAFSGAGLAGKRLVAFETMTCGGEEYMVHADIEDEGQTVAVVDIATTAVNPETGDATGVAADGLGLLDTVEYTGLAPGAAYTMTGHIADAETGELLMDADGNAYVREVAFTPEASEGTVEVAFEIDASPLSGRTTVFTETLSDAEGNVVAVHDDTADANQSIFFPNIRTDAVDGADGDKNLVAGESAVIVDTVTYENLIPGKEYVVTGVLMDKVTGEPLKDAQGNGVSASAAFTPESPDGEVEVAFEFDATGLGGKSAVVFESLVKDGIEVATHADIEDEAQTVAIVEPEEDVPEEETPGKGYPKTGAAATAVAAGAGGIALAAYGMAGAASALLKRRKGASDDQDEDA